MTNSEVHTLAEELNSRAEKLTLSHAVLATGIMLEEKNISTSKINERKLQQIEEKKITTPHSDLKKIAEEEKKLKENCVSKVYISIGHLKGGECLGARTFYYKRESKSDSNNKQFVSEHYEILLPKNEKIVEYTNGVISFDRDRFAVGHELGHLWLHLDKLKKIINNMLGTKHSKFSNKQIECEADKFSLKLSELRDKHLKELSKQWLKG